MPESSAIHVKLHYEDGSFWATVDEFPGVFATGDDLEELRESLEEGISLMLAGPDEEPQPVHLSPLELPETPADAVLEPA